MLMSLGYDNVRKYITNVTRANFTKTMNTNFRSFASTIFHSIAGSDLLDELA